MKTLNPLVQEWTRHADDDELNARSIFKHKDGTANAVCFLCQQTAEKLLKSILVFLQKETPKIHDLLTLKDLLAKYGINAEDLKKDLATLNGYYIGTRYPGEDEDFSWQDAEEALKSLDKIKNFVKLILEK